MSLVECRGRERERFTDVLIFLVYHIEKKCVNSSKKVRVKNDRKAGWMDRWMDGWVGKRMNAQMGDGMDG